MTRNGEGDLVVMDIDAFVQREAMLKLRENLIIAEEERLKGKPGFSIDDTANMMRRAVQEVVDGEHRK